MARLALLLFSSSALAHPGHGALEIHWHFDDLVFIAVGILVLFLMKKALKK
jgi:hypothetical protein